MPQERLHDPQVGTVLHQVGCEGVPQAVRREIGLDPGTRGEAAHQGEDRLARQAFPARREKDVPATCVGRQAWTLGAQVEAERSAGGTPERNQSFLVPLAQHPQRALLQEEQVEGQRDRLAYPQPGPVEHLDQRTVAQRRRRPVRGREQLLDLAPRRARRQPAALGGLAHVCKRTFANQAFADGEAEQAPERRQASRLGTRPDAAFTLRRLEAEHQLATDSLDLAHAEAPPGKPGEARQVVRVGGIGMRRDAHLAAQPRQVAIDRLVDLH